jgi:hypothetical protein
MGYGGVEFYSAVLFEVFETVEGCVNTGVSGGWSVPAGQEWSKGDGGAVV